MSGRDKLLRRFHGQDRGAAPGDDQADQTLIVIEGVGDGAVADDARRGDRVGVGGLDENGLAVADRVLVAEDPGPQATEEIRRAEDLHSVVRGVEGVRVELAVGAGGQDPPVGQ